MKPSEAETKWCPMARYANGHQASNCAVNQDRSPAACIGPNCAMWRWYDQPRTPRWASTADTRLTEAPARRPDEIPAAWEFVPADGRRVSRYQEPKAERDADRHGYCGLAGEIKQP